jgi:hypothetical protein
LQGTPTTVGHRKAGSGSGLSAPTKGFAEARQHKLSGIITPIDRSGVSELLDNHLLGLVDDHAPGGITIRFEGGGLLDYPGQSTRESAKRAGSETHIAKIKVKSSTDSLFVLDIGAVGDRGEILGQIFERDLRTRAAIRGHGSGAGIGGASGGRSGGPGSGGCGMGGSAMRVRG